MGIFNRSAGELFVRLHVARVAGLGLFLVGLLRYRSYSNRPAFGLWSYPFFLLLVTASVLWLSVLVRALRSLRRANARPGLGPSFAGNLLDWSWLTWGIAFFLDAMDAPSNAGRVTEFVFFGSIIPVAAILQWVTQVLLFLAVATYIVPTLQGRRAKAGLAAGTFVVLALLGEGYLRMRVALAPATDHYLASSAVAWERRYVKLNREGWRDIDHPVGAAKGIRRGLVVGDSFAYGYGIRRVEDRLGEQLGVRLSRRTGQLWEVINVSRPAADTLDEIEYLKRGLQYRPEFVVLLYVFNDIDYLVQRPPMGILPTSLGPYHLVSVLYRNSYLFQVILLRSYLPYYSSVYEKQPDPYDDPTLVSRHLEDVARFVAIARENGAIVQVVPFNISVRLLESQRSIYARFVTAARAQGIPICSLENVYDAYAYGDLIVSAADSHPNELSNSLAADAVAKCLPQL